MGTVSSMPRKKSWQGQRRRVSVLAEMALRQEKVSARLLELRERQGLSQEDAARKVGITTRQWQRWETGESMPYPRNLDLVASRFGISVSEFFDEDAPTIPKPDQLDRIEAKLDKIIEHLGIGEETVPTLAALRTADAEDAKRRPERDVEPLEPTGALPLDAPAVDPNPQGSDESDSRQDTNGQTGTGG